MSLLICAMLRLVGGSNPQSITELLTFASSQVVPAPNREPWDYGWAYRDYRHSERAALTGREGPVTLTSKGISAWENAVTSLLRDKRIQDRWDAEEFWGLLASLAIAASEKEENRTAFVERCVETLRKNGPALTIQLVANVTWGRSPLILGDAVIGDVGVKFLSFVNASAGTRSQVNDELGKSWLDKQVKPRLVGKAGVPPVAIACWTVGQRTLARRETERQLRNIVDLTVLLERDLAAHKIYERGDTNRPGIRGLTLDRGAVEHGLGDSSLELASFPLTISSPVGGDSVEWFSAEPLPLGDLLDQDYLRDAVKSCLQIDPISNRIRVAARWFAEAHYTPARDDAALALGVAMDALLGGQRALPGSAMADRFALLAEDPKVRRKLVADYLSFYSARSSVAHGAQSSKLDQPDFLTQYRTTVHWAAWRSIALRDTFTPSSEKQVDALYDDLRWGARSWA